MSNRKGNVRIELRVTEEERRLITDRMKDAGVINLTKRAHETGRLYEADVEGLREQLDELWEGVRGIMSEPASLRHSKADEAPHGQEPEPRRCDYQAAIRRVRYIAKRILRFGDI